VIGAVDAGKAARALADALASTFAELCFIDVIPAPEPAGAPVPDPICAAIDMLRPLSCRIELECPGSLRRKIDGILFQGGEAEGGDDSLLEILNVVAGAFATSCFGPGADIKLGLPGYLYGSEEPAEGAALAVVEADAEGDAIRATLRSVRYRY